MRPPWPAQLARHQYKYVNHPFGCKNGCNPNTKISAPRKQKLCDIAEGVIFRRTSQPYKLRARQGRDPPPEAASRPGAARQGTARQDAARQGTARHSDDSALGLFSTLWEDFSPEWLLVRPPWPRAQPARHQYNKVHYPFCCNRVVVRRATSACQSTIGSEKGRQTFREPFFYTFGREPKQI